MDAPTTQLPWPQIEIVAATLLNWLVTQAWKIALPSKPLNPVLVSSIIGAAIAALVIGLRGHDSAPAIAWAVFVAVASIFGASAIHKIRSTNRAIKRIAENGTP